MELRHLRYFLTVAEEMNFTRAAEKLMIAQPPLSRQIRDLEEELGVPLFLRKPHDLRLTEEGMLFRQYATQILELSDRSVEEVRALNQGLHGMLYLGLVEGSAPHLLSGWIADFHALHPNVQYDLWNGNSDDVIARVTRGLCELAVIMAPFNAEDLEGIPVYEEPWVAIMSPQHPLAAAHGDDVPLSALEPWDLIVPSRASRQQEINAWFAAANLTPRILCRLSSAINAIELASQTLGVAIYPASQAHAAANTATLQKRISPAVTAQYVLVRSRSRHLSRAASEFAAFVQARRGETLGEPL